MKKIYWAGDSTVAFNGIVTYPQTGIGQVFGLYLSEDAKVVNYAVNGRSTKSFMAEGRLKAIEREITKEDFLFIQFGHNDEKKRIRNVLPTRKGSLKTICASIFPWQEMQAHGRF